MGRTRHRGRRFRSDRTPEVTVAHCGAEIGVIPVGQETQLNAQVRNHEVGGTAGIFADVIWFVNGVEVGRVNDFEVAPDRTRWANLVTVVSDALDESVYGTEVPFSVELENRRWKFPSDHS